MDALRALWIVSIKGVWLSELHAWNCSLYSFSTNKKCGSLKFTHLETTFLAAALCNKRKKVHSLVFATFRHSFKTHTGHQTVMPPVQVLLVGPLVHRFICWLLSHKLFSRRSKVRRACKQWRLRCLASKTQKAGSDEATDRRIWLD